MNTTRQRMADHYTTLGVDPDADHDTIAAAWRRACRTTHPDVGGTADAFRAVQEAWEVLRDPHSRAAYDQRHTRQHHDPHQQTRSQSGPKAAPRGRHQTVGTPGHNLDRGAYAGPAGTAGLDGEREVAAALDRLDLGPDVWIFHDLTPPGGAGNIDHVVLAGDTLIVLDSKRWRTGTYVYGHTESVLNEIRYDRNGRPYEHVETVVDDMVWRDGEPFEPALGHSFTHLADILERHLNSPLTVHRALVLSAPNGNHDGYNLDRYTPPGFNVTTVNQLGWIEQLCANEPNPLPHPALLTQLRTMTTGKLDAADPPVTVDPNRLADALTDPPSPQGDIDGILDTADTLRRALRRRMFALTGTLWASIVGLMAIYLAQPGVWIDIAIPTVATAIAAAAARLAYTRDRHLVDTRQQIDTLIQPHLPAASLRRWIASTLEWRFDRLGTAWESQPDLAARLRRTWPLTLTLHAVAFAGDLALSIVTVAISPTGAPPQLFTPLIAVPFTVFAIIAVTGKSHPGYNRIDIGRDPRTDIRRFATALADPAWWPWLRAALRWSIAQPSPGAQRLLEAIGKIAPDAYDRITEPSR